MAIVATAAMGRPGNASTAGGGLWASSPSADRAVLCVISCIIYRAQLAQHHKHCTNNRAALPNSAPIMSHLLTTCLKIVVRSAGMMVGINAPYYTIGYQAVRRVDATQPSYSLVNQFTTGRWYPGIMTLPDGNVLVVGGAQIVSHWPSWFPRELSQGEEQRYQALDQLTADT